MALAQQFIPDTFMFNAEITKAHKESNGDWLVEGIASFPKWDHEGEFVRPEGLDLSYFIEKGFIKWEHGKNPKQFIGEPVEARVIPKQGLYIKARLYAASSMAKDAIDALEVLQKSNAKRKLGWSVEGSVLERDESDPGIVSKALVRNAVLTFNPVNDGTWAKLCKSLSTSSDSGQAIMPESLEMDVKNKFDISKYKNLTKKQKKKLLKAFKKYLKSLFGRNINKSINMDYAKDIAMYDAIEGLDETEIEFLNEYTLEKSNQIHKIAVKIMGGEYIMDELLKALDDSMDAIEKSLEDDDTLEKSVDSEVLDGDEAEIEDETMDEDDNISKSFEDALLENETAAEAIEVSEFLGDMVKGLSESLSSLEKSFNAPSTLEKSMAQAVVSMGKLTKSINEKVENLEETFSGILKRPLGRRFVVDGREVNSISKSLDTDTEPKKNVTKQDILDELIKGADKGDWLDSEVTKFELGGVIRNPDVAAKVKERLGL